MLNLFFQNQRQKDLLTVFATSSIGTTPANILDKIRTPGINYISGYDLKRFGDSWVSQVVAATQGEQHLLTKTSLELKTVMNEHHIIIAVDTRRKHMVVGCIALWRLGVDENECDWFELGTLWVKPEYRFHGERHMPIADALYRRLLANNQDKNILATTTNLRAIHLGMRHGMQMISFRHLPKKTQYATCVCPFDKTKSLENAYCILKNKECRVRVPFPTWQRMGKPTRSTDFQTTTPS